MRVYAGATNDLTASQDVTEECVWKPVFPYSTGIHGNRNDFWPALSALLETALVFIIALQRERHNSGAQVAVDKKSATGAGSAGSLSTQRKRKNLSCKKKVSFLSPNGSKEKWSEKENASAARTF